MGLQFVIGGSGSGKSHYVHHFMVEEAKKNPREQYFILVPEQFTMQTQMDLVRTHSKGIINIDVLSFGRMSHRLFEENGSDELPVLDDTGKSLILRKIAGEHAESLPVIGSHLKKTGYVHEVKSALSEFYQYGIDREKMNEMISYAQNRNALRYKLKDLAEIYQFFSDYINEKYITKEEILDQAARKIKESALLKDSVIILDGFTGFTPVQIRFLEQLFCVAKKVMVTVTLDTSRKLSEKYEEQDLFAMSRKMMDSLSNLADETGFLKEKPVILGEAPVYRFRENRELAFLEQNLFRYGNGTYPEEVSSISIFEADNPRQEIHEVCKRVNYLVRTKGYQYRDFALVTGAQSDYEYFIEEECRKMGIPLYMDRTTRLSGNPGMDYVMSALQTVSGDFSYEDVFHLLRNRLSGFDDNEVDLLENYCLEKGIRTRAKYERLFTAKPTDTKLFEERLVELNEIREKVVLSLKPIRRRKASVKEHVEAVYEFLVINSVSDKLSACADEFNEANDLARAKEYGQVYREMITLLDQFVSLLGDEVMSFQEFMEILKAGFEECKVGTLPQNVDRFVAGDIERTRLSNVKVLFFVGVNDGIIPKKGGSSGIINDIDREFLYEGSFEMAPGPRQKMYIQRFYLYLNMTKPTEELILSFVKTNAEGKNIRPSYLIETIRKMFPSLSIKTTEESGMISSRSDGLKRLTENLREYAADRLENKTDLYSLYDVLKEDSELSIYTEKLTKAAFYRYESLPMKPQVVRALYGAVLHGSVSRFETFSRCAYRYFLQYGLKLKEREGYAFETRDLGTIFHAVMYTFAEELKKENYNWFNFPKEAAERMIDKAVEEAAAGFGDTVLYSTARQEYAISKMKRIMKRTVDTLQFQLKQGRFIPTEFETEFKIELKQGQELCLEGRIDRMDLMEQDDKVYVKVVDYKSGNKDFDLAELYYGRQLQLVIYMNAALAKQRGRFPDKEVVPAGMLYYTMKDPFVERNPKDDSDEAILEEIRKTLRPKGIILEQDTVVDALDSEFTGKSLVIPVERKKDGSFSSHSDVFTREQMDLISEFVTAKIKSFGEEIMSGVVKRNPCSLKEHSSCEYCEFKGKCGLDEKLPGEEIEELQILKDEEIFAGMQEFLKNEETRNK